MPETFNHQAIDDAQGDHVGKTRAPIRGGKIQKGIGMPEVEEERGDDDLAFQDQMVDFQMDL
jgi:hypothetical protein